MENWKIKIEEEIYSNLVKVWIYRFSDGKGEIWRADNTTETLTEGQAEVEPSFKMPSMLFGSLKEQMKNKEKEFTSELIATKYHLEDLRRLLKLK
jgi:hypothetical protein